MYIIKLWHIRQRQGLSVRALSEKSGVSFSAINAIENGKQSPTLFTLDLLAQALHCSIKDLFYEVDINNDNSKKINFED